MSLIQEKYSILLSKNTSQVWLDFSSQLVVIEYEQEDPHTISLAIIDYKKGVKQLNDIHISQNTFISIKHIEKGNIIIQKYISSSSQLPNPNGFLIYSIFENKIIFDYPSSSFINQINNELIIREQQTENIVYKKIIIQEPLSIEIIPFDFVLKMEKENRSILTFPQLYREGEAYFQEVAFFLKNNYQLDPHRMIYYMEYAPFILVSCYIWKENQEKNIFMIFNTKETDFQQEDLLLDFNKINSSSFFMIENQLFIINTKNQLMSYDL